MERSRGGPPHAVAAPPLERMKWPVASVITAATSSSACSALSSTARSKRVQWAPATACTGWHGPHVALHPEAYPSGGAAAPPGCEAEPKSQNNGRASHHGDLELGKLQNQCLGFARLIWKGDGGLDVGLFALSSSTTPLPNLAHAFTPPRAMIQRRLVARTSAMSSLRHPGRW